WSYLRKSRHTVRPPDCRPIAKSGRGASMTTTRWLPILTVSAVAFGLGGRAVAAELTPDRFESLHELIQPTAEEEQWLQIPWQTDLLEARRLAAEQDRPLLLWEMDGNPLGCG